MAIKQMTTQYYSLIPLVGVSVTYPLSTIFQDNGDGTCSPLVNGTPAPDRFFEDPAVFVSYDPNNPVPLPGQVFWSFDNYGNILQIKNDGSGEPLALIKAGFFWFTQPAAQAAFQVLQSSPKQ